MVNGYMAASLKEALEIRKAHLVTPYAGGTDLMVENRQGVSYLFINKVRDLKKIILDDCYLRIGAGVTFTQALSDSQVPQLMKDAVSLIAAPAIRNAGTFGGNIGNGSAKADTVLIHYVTNAKLRLASLNDERIIDIDQLYLGQKKLDLADDELIVEILLPNKGLENYYYKKVAGRKALAISRVSFAGVLALEEGKIVNIAVAFGAVANTVLRFKDLEAMMIGKTLPEAKAVKEAYLNAYADRLMLTEGRVSAEYRKTVCMNLLNDFLTEKGI